MSGQREGLQFTDGIKAARETTNLADQYTADEMADVFGVDRPQMRSAFQQGYDYAILHARKHGGAA